MQTSTCDYEDDVNYDSPPTFSILFSLWTRLRAISASTRSHSSSMQLSRAASTSSFTRGTRLLSHSGVHTGYFMCESVRSDFVVKTGYFNINSL